MTDETTPPSGEILVYQTEDGRTRVECRFEQEELTGYLNLQLSCPRRLCHCIGVFGDAVSSHCH